MTEREIETLDRLAARRGSRLRGPRFWLKAYLTGLILLIFAAIGTLGYVTIKHPPPPGTTTLDHLSFTMAMVIQQVGYERQAFELLKVLAEKGHSEAQSLVGQIYNTGAGVAQNAAEAAKWYQLAADQGHPAALNNLAAHYLEGRGVSQDMGRAVALYHRAARSGDPVAQTNLGQLYLNGRGVPRDPSEAISWFRKAARQDHGPAMYFLGLMQLRGWGLPQDREEARSWFAKAAEAGSAQAERALEEME